ncbi:MAG: hypothetical protein NC452_15695, partial [Eubacterium sp.]|nr:hypothetical protein [Eubacterium sp.]
MTDIEKCGIIKTVMGGKFSNHLRQAMKNFRGVRTWQLALILIPLVFVTATLLRLDHIKMAHLRAAVLEADVANDDAAIQTSLTELQDFVFSHIVINVVETNGVQSIVFGTGPFYLEQQYLRAANAAIEEAESQLANDANPNGNIYAAAQAVCRPLAIENGWAWNSQGYLDCWTTELAKYPASESLDAQLTAKIPSTELYRHNYASPLWAPTWAGWAILACAILFLVVVIRFAIW